MCDRSKELLIALRDSERRLAHENGRLRKENKSSGSVGPSLSEHDDSVQSIVKEKKIVEQTDDDDKLREKKNKWKSKCIRIEKEKNLYKFMLTVAICWIAFSWFVGK